MDLKKLKKKFKNLKKKMKMLESMFDITDKYKNGWYNGEKAIGYLSFKKIIKKLKDKNDDKIVNYEDEKNVRIKLKHLPIADDGHCLFYCFLQHLFDNGKEEYKFSGIITKRNDNLTKIKKEYIKLSGKFLSSNQKPVTELRKIIGPWTKNLEKANYTEWGDDNQIKTFTQIWPEFQVVVYFFAVSEFDSFDLKQIVPRYFKNGKEVDGVNANTKSIILFLHTEMYKKSPRTKHYDTFNILAKPLTKKELKEIVESASGRKDRKNYESLKK